MAVVLQNLYESKGTSFTSALAVSRQSSTSQKADPEFVLKPIAEGLLHNIAQLVVPNGKGKIDDDAATRAAIRAEADAIGESDIEAIMFEEYEWQDREQIGTLINVSDWLNLQRNTFWSNTRLAYKNNILTKQWLVFKKRYIVVEDDSDEECE